MCRRATRNAQPSTSANRCILVTFFFFFASLARLSPAHMTRGAPEVSRGGQKRRRAKTANSHYSLLLHCAGARNSPPAIRPFRVSSLETCARKRLLCRTLAANFSFSCTCGTRSVLMLLLLPGFSWPINRLATLNRDEWGAAVSAGRLSKQLRAGELPSWRSERANSFSRSSRQLGRR